MMPKAISTQILKKHRLHSGHLDTLQACDVQGIEVFAARQHFDYTSRPHVKEIADWFKDHAVKPWALHAPLYSDLENGRSGAPSVNVVHPEKSRRIDAMDEVKRALESAEQIPFSHMILHLGERDDSWSNRALENSITAVEHLRAFARPLGVQILLENLDKNEIAQPSHLVEILSVGHFHDIGICLDLGHAHLGSGLEEAIGILGDRIRSLHVHDNAGDKDAHLWPGEGTIAWPQAARALQALTPPPMAVLEISSRLETSNEALADQVRKSFALLENGTLS